MTDDILYDSLPVDVLQDAKILWDYHHLSPCDEAAYRDPSDEAGGSNASSAAVVPAGGQGKLRATGTEEERAERVPQAAPFSAILAFGSHDRRVARRAAELFLAVTVPRDVMGAAMDAAVGAAVGAAMDAAGGAAPGGAMDAAVKAALGDETESVPLLLITGGRGRLTEPVFSETEAALFRQEALRIGVPEDVIYIEDKSSNTGENIAFTKALLRWEGLLDRVQAGTVLVVDKPARERRTWAALKKQWPALAFQITSPRCTFAECMAYYRAGAEGVGLTVEDYLQLMLDDLKRLEAYPDRGFQIPVRIPAEVKAAGARLAAFLARLRTSLQ